jgi:hypothetical protein
MFAIDETFSCNESFADYPIVKPNIRTGEGRTKFRLTANRQKDLKKKAHRKMAKKSRRTNRR